MSNPTPSMKDPFNAFCRDSSAYLEGSADGPLSGLTFAAKDIFDIAGHVTGGGNPDWKATQPAARQTARAVQALVDAGATMVGKTITDEITRGIFGENVHYGTPTNPRAPGRVPGGSSSGSASAVAGELVDFALGSDTGGSVRVPASYCGLYGLRPTHGRIPLDGVLPQAASYDTVGWFARDPETFARVGGVLLSPQNSAEIPRHLLIALDAFELADPHVEEVLQPQIEKIIALVKTHSEERLSPTGLAEWADQQQVLQGREAWESMRDWIDRVNPRFSFEVSDRYAQGRAISDEQVAAAREIKTQVLVRMDQLLTGGTVICLPTTVGPAPPTGQRLSDRTALRQRNSQLTCIAGTIGGPQINLPLAEVDGLPVGLSLLGARESDEMLITFARKIGTELGC